MHEFIRWIYLTEFSDLFKDTNISPEDYVTQSSLRADLDKLMTNLTHQQRQVISLRFGLDNGKALTLTKIGEWLNISRESVRQLEKQALKRLRQSKVNLQEYLVS